MAFTRKKKKFDRVYRTVHLPDFGTVINKYRVLAGYNQATLAKIFNVTASTISNWERNFSRPDVQLVPMICEVLQVPLRELFCIEEKSYDKDEEELLSVFHALTAQGKQTAQELLQVIKNDEVESHKAMLRSKYHLYADYHMAASAGPTIHAESQLDPDVLFLRQDVLDQIPKSFDSLCSVTGDSMEPTYHNGDKLLLQKTSSLSEGEVGVFEIEGCLYVKVYKKKGLSSINPNYETMIPKNYESIRCMARVVGVLPDNCIASGDRLPALERAFSKEIKALEKDFYK